MGQNIRARDKSKIKTTSVEVAVGWGDFEVAGVDFGSDEEKLGEAQLDFQKGQSRAHVISALHKSLALQKLVFSTLKSSD